MTSNRLPERTHNGLLVKSLWTLAVLSCISLAPVVRRARGADAGAAPSPDHVAAPPATRVEEVTDDYFGTKVIDPYRWLEDQTSAATRKWIDDENAYTNGLLDSLPGLDALKARLAKFLNVDAAGLPSERGGRYFFEKRNADQDQSVLYMRRGLTGPDVALVDPNALDPDHRSSVVLEDVSLDGKLIWYGMRKGGEDETTPHLLDVDTGQELSDRFPRALYLSVSITPDRTGIYYSKSLPEGSRVFYHKIGTDAATDQLIFGQGYDAGVLIGSDLSEDGRYLEIDVHYGAGGTKTEIWIKDVAHDGPIRPLVKDIDARFEGEFAADHLFLYTNWNAPKGRVLLVDLNHPERENWKIVVPEGDGVIEMVAPANGMLVVHYSENASSRLSVFTAEGKMVREIELPAIGSVRGFSARWGSSEAFFSFATYTMPQAIYRFDFTKAATEVWWRPQIPFDGKDYVINQVWFASKDGTHVPMFVVYKKGLKLDGTHPALLTGYGGFDVPEQPAFTTTAAAWVEAGGVFADASLRGGSEFGEAWHKAGMLGNKQNVFDDFIAAAEYLEKNGYTSASRLAIYGASNGGLLVGAALTQRPELFRAVVCAYPLLDMLRYQNFLVARWWVPEYGSSDDPKQFAYLDAYSPYQNVKKGVKYPAVLFLTGDSDTRVAPLHARKMAALLQADAAPGRPILLHYDTHAGHSGGTPISQQVTDSARIFAFLDWQLGAPIQ